MKPLSKSTTFSLIISSFVFSLGVGANELKSVKSLQLESSKLEKSIVRAKNISPTLKKMASRDAAFKKAVITDLEKQCGGKAKTDKNCTKKYVKNLKVNMTRLSRSNGAVSNLNNKLNKYRLSEIKKLELVTNNMRKNLPKSIDLINTEFNNSIRLKIKTLPIIEKNQLQKDFLDKNKKIINKSNLMKEIGASHGTSQNRNSDLAFQLEEEIKNKLILIVDTLIKPAQAEPVSAIIVLALTAAAVVVIERYTNYKISVPQLDKGAICIDESDVRHNRCLSAATRSARQTCRSIGNRFFRGVCEVTAREVKKAACRTSQAGRIAACLLLPQ